MTKGQPSPHSGKYIAYYRVSTSKQGRSGLGLEAQKEIVQRHLNGGDWSIIAEFTEVESGKKSDRRRPELKKALDLCEAEGAILVVAKLDRLTRNVPFLSTLLERQARFIACDIPDMGNPAQNRFILQMMANIAEFEAEQTSARTKVALAAAKKRGVVLGSPNPQAGAKKGGRSSAKIADEHAAEVNKVIEELQRYGCDTLQKIAKGLEARGVKTSRGGAKWYPSSVKNMLARKVKRAR